MKTSLSKTTIPVFLLLIAFALTSVAKAGDVNKHIAKKFEQTYKNAANVTWKRTNDFTSAAFTLNGENVTVFYDNNFNLVAVSKIITVSDLPKATQRLLQNKYAAYNVASVIDYTDADSVYCYYVQLNKGDKKVILHADEFGSVCVF